MSFSIGPVNKDILHRVIKVQCSDSLNKAIPSAIKKKDNLIRG